MIKKVFFFIILLSTFFIVPKAFACDPLGCLFSGHKQDTLLLGEAISNSESLTEIKVIFVFPQNQVKFLNDGDHIKVQDQILNIGKKYVLSLNRHNDVYIPAWGVYEVTGENYSDVQLVKKETADEAALQVFINSGGTETDFYFIDDRVFLKNEGHPDTQIYPRQNSFSLVLLIVSILSIVLLGLFIRKRQRKT